MSTKQRLQEFGLRAGPIQLTFLESGQVSFSWQFSNKWIGLTADSLNKALDSAEELLGKESNAKLIRKHEAVTWEERNGMAVIHEALRESA